MSGFTPEVAPMNSVLEFVQQYGPLFAILGSIAAILGLAITF